MEDTTIVKLTVKELRTIAKGINTALLHLENLEEYSCFSKGIEQSNLEVYSFLKSQLKLAYYEMNEVKRKNFLSKHVL